MTDQEFFDFAYEEYKAELQLAYTLPQRVGILLTAATLVGGASAALVRIDLICRSLERWDLLLVHVSSILVMACLAFGVAFLFVTTFPREYPKVNKLFFWIRWRSEYQKMLETDDPEALDRNRSALSEATQAAILEKLSDAQTTAAYVNQNRLAAYQKSVFCIASGVVAVAMQGVFALIVALNGV